MRVISIVKVRLLQHIIQNITAVSKNRLEKLLQACAGFVKCKYGCKNDVVDLKWLLPEERIDSSILKLVYNGINKEKMPANLKLELKKPTRAPRNDAPIIIAKDKYMNTSTFMEEANKIFKELPSNIKQEIRTISSYSFKDKLKKYMFDRILARALSSQRFCFVIYIYCYK